ncbi:MAG: hypothetical protein ACKVXR_16270 [Planctomycetota bacterium]
MFATTGFLPALRAREARIQPRTFFALAFVALLALHARSLYDPPYWDALVGAFPQGYWLARNDFDLVRLVTMEPTCGEGGPNVYPYSIYPLGIALLYALHLPTQVVFLVMHLFALLSAATAATAFFVLARERLPAPLGSLATLLLVSTPIFQSLASQMNMDMALCACTIVSLLALVRRKFGVAFLAALLALLVIPRGVILVAANASFLGLAAFRPSWTGLSGRGAEPQSPRGVQAWTLAHLGLLGIFLVEIQIARAYANLPVHVGLFEGFGQFFRQALWMIPEFGAVFLAALLCGLMVFRRARRGEARPLDFACAMHLLVFVVFYGQYKNTLPRYFFQVYPHVILLVLAAAPAAARLRWLAPAAVTLAIAANAVNHEGAFYHHHGSGWATPPTAKASPLSADGHLLERSMKYRQDLLLGLDVARYLERFERDRLLVVANWPLAQALAVPEFGYVDRAWSVSSRPRLTYAPQSVHFDNIYDRTGGLLRPKTRTDVLWAIVPNAYFRPGLAPREGYDEVLAILEHGGFEAFLFRRGSQ